MVKRDTPGYAIGGLSGGEAKDDFWKMVRYFEIDSFTILSRTFILQF